MTTSLTFTSLRGRAARPKASLTSGLAKAAAAVTRAMRAAAVERARREMCDFATRCEVSQPQLAAELRAACAHLASR